MESAEFRLEMESDLVYLATFAMHDPIKLDVEKSVHLIKYGVSGRPNDD